jgi:hypothetical protein
MPSASVANTLAAIDVPIDVLRTPGLLCTLETADDWHPGPGSGAKGAREDCEFCPARIECASFAQRTMQAFGIWGGFDPQQRRRIARRWGNDAPRYVAEALRLGLDADDIATGILNRHGNVA